MFSIGFFEICVIAVVALILVGPHKLPELMKQAGQFFVQARRMSSEVKSTVDNVIKEAERNIDEDLRQEKKPEVSPRVVDEKRVTSRGDEKKPIGANEENAQTLASQYKSVSSETTVTDL